VHRVHQVQRVQRVRRVRRVQQVQQDRLSGRKPLRLSPAVARPIVGLRRLMRAAALGAGVVQAAEISRLA
jgi:hypothetical protein